MKRCAKCGQTVPIDRFNADRTRKSGRYPYCKRCTSRIDKARRPLLPKSNSYGAVHSRLPSHYGLRCVRCERPAQEWAYDHADPRELISDRGRPYSADPRHYFPMCRSCHRSMDAARGPRPAARRMKSCASCGRLFWNASHKRKTCSPACETALRSASQRRRQAASRELAALARRS